MFNLNFYLHEADPLQYVAINFKNSNPLTHHMIIVVVVTIIEMSRKSAKQLGEQVD